MDIFVNQVCFLSLFSFFTLSLILSVLSGSSPPPPRLRSSVMLRSRFRRDVKVSHKPRRGTGSRTGSKREERDNNSRSSVSNTVPSVRSGPWRSIYLLLTLKRVSDAAEPHERLAAGLRVFVYHRSQLLRPAWLPPGFLSFRLTAVNVSKAIKRSTSCPDLQIKGFIYCGQLRHEWKAQGYYYYYYYLIWLTGRPQWVLKFDIGTGAAADG